MSQDRPPRVLLVDDEAAVRQLMTMALEDFPWRLECCASVAEAQAALRAEPADVIVTDLMMVGASGFELLDALRADPSQRAGARIVVCSASVDEATRARLAPHALFQVLVKPVSVLGLQRCLEAAVDAPPVVPASVPPARAARPSSRVAAGPPPAASPPAASPPAASPPAASPPADSPPADSRAAADEAAAVAQLFGGDRALYQAYRALCLAQFPDDLRRAAQARARHDAAALRRLAHSLKTVLASLGEPVAAEAARRAERAWAAGDDATADAAWPTVQAALQRLGGVDANDAED